jgi:uroporphyrin-III C-methyltransferase
VTAAFAAAASAGASLTRRGVARSVALLTPRVGEGQEPNAAWLDAAMGADSVALYMAAGASQEIAHALVGAGKPPSTPALLVEAASLPDERRTLTTLEQLLHAPLPRAAGPVVMLVGPAFANALANPESVPHFPSTAFAP